MLFKPSSQPLSIGSDIIEIKRIKDAIDRHGVRFINRLFTLKEQSYCRKYKNPTQHFAGRFAAKEAVIKALSKGFHHLFSWKDIEILNNEEGKPSVFFSEKLAKAFPKREVLVSISHCRQYATATALLV